MVDKSNFLSPLKCEGLSEAKNVQKQFFTEIHIELPKFREDLLESSYKDDSYCFLHNSANEVVALVIWQVSNCTSKLVGQHVDKITSGGNHLIITDIYSTPELSISDLFDSLESWQYHTFESGYMAWSNKDGFITNLSKIWGNNPKIYAQNLKAELVYGLGYKNKNIGLVHFNIIDAIELSFFVEINYTGCSISDSIYKTADLIVKIPTSTISILLFEQENIDIRSFRAIKPLRLRVIQIYGFRSLQHFNDQSKNL